MCKQFSIDFNLADRISSSSKYDDFEELCKMASRVSLTIVNGCVIK